MRHVALMRFLATVIAFSAATGFAGAQSTDIFSGFSGKSGAPIEVDAETLEIIEEGDQRVSIFDGGVTITRGNTTMKAVTVKLFTAKKSDDSNAFTRMEATGGKVYVNSGNQTVTGNSAVVDNLKQTITLDGDVVLSQGKNVIVADRLVIDMASGKAKVDVPGGRIQGIFSPGGLNKKPDGSQSQ